MKHNLGVIINITKWGKCEGAIIDVTAVKQRIWGHHRPYNYEANVSME
jgi:hypothetical protein